MPRRRRILRNVATALSLVLLAATVALWAESHSAGRPDWPFAAPANGAAPVSSGGRLQFGRLSAPRVVSPGPDRMGFATTGDQPVMVLGGNAETAVVLPRAIYPTWLGCTFERGTLIPPGGLGGFRLRRTSPDTAVIEADGSTTLVAYQTTSVPYALPAAFFAALPLARAARGMIRRARRRARLSVARAVRATRCRACGYDCRANPGRCPECGAAR